MTFGWLVLPPSKSLRQIRASQQLLRVYVCRMCVQACVCVHASAMHAILRWIQDGCVGISFISF